MPRMFDILRGKVDQKKPKAKDTVSEKDADLVVSFPRQIREGFGDQEKSEDAFQVSKKLIDAVKKKDLDNPEIAEERYEHTLGVVDVLLERVGKEEPLGVYLDEIYETIDGLINQLILGNSLLENVAREYPVDNYLARHITNVCILSLAVGIEMNLNKSKLHTLCMAALLHDIGMLGVKDIIGQARELADDEFREVKNHTLIGAEIVSKMEGPYDVIKEIIQQHHERANGRGYPLGIGGDKVNDYALLLGLVDTYEAITHPRPHRKAKMPHQAIREIMGSLKLFFEPTIIKALVDKLSIYPVGSFVKLNTREIAKVISSNASSPLRPVVLILLDSYGKHMPKPKPLDLSENSSTYIKEPTSLTKDKI